ncbi:hypothetical protein C2845_PM03G16270 [Panicum miliaceum]|uniref:Uncharacterized protein n=1 Tax=Panicum miliaceum TaxID=4540 RepID=A0A3L6T5B7_PANMI|nr:hypothetical protein C2845_PM03G16270 [Panicum miliaceum]
MAVGSARRRIVSRMYSPFVTELPFLHRKLLRLLQLRLNQRKGLDAEGGREAAAARSHGLPVEEEGAAVLALSVHTHAVKLGLERFLLVFCPDDTVLVGVLAACAQHGALEQACNGRIWDNEGQECAGLDYYDKRPGNPWSLGVLTARALLHRGRAGGRAHLALTDMEEEQPDDGVGNRKEYEKIEFPDLKLTEAEAEHA